MKAVELTTHYDEGLNPEAACRLENTVFQVTGSKMVATKKKGLTVDAVNP